MVATVHLQSNINNSPSDDFNLLQLPHHILVDILSHFSYAETSQLREVCQAFNTLCRMRLCDGFKKVDQYHNVIHKRVKTQLPRRESERHNHPLARHVNILSAVETRLSLLSMTFTKYIDSDLCCFIPGKVLDELFRILGSLKCINTIPPRAHEFLQELRDISSMAMEHFDECIVPILKQQMPSHSNSFNTSMTILGVGDVDESFGPMTNVVQYRTPQTPTKEDPSRSRDLHIQKTVIKALRKGLNESKSKINDQRKLLSEQDKKIAELTSRVDKQDTKIADMTQKMLLCDKKFSDIFSVFPKLSNSSYVESPRKDSPVCTVTESGNTTVPTGSFRQLRAFKRARKSAESNHDTPKVSSRSKKMRK